jgi:hypothetical protein
MLVFRLKRYPKMGIFYIYNFHFIVIFKRNLKKWVMKFHNAP